MLSARSSATSQLRFRAALQQQRVQVWAHRTGLAAMLWQSFKSPKGSASSPSVAPWKLRSNEMKSGSSQQQVLSNKKQPMPAATSSSCAPLPDSVEVQANFAHSSQCGGPNTQHHVSKACKFFV
jgi:hypothetical protein